MSTFVAPSVVLYATHLSRMVAFYRQVLDVPVLTETGEYVVLDCGAMRLIIHAIPSAIAETILIQDPPVRREEAALKLSLPVQSLDRARARAVASGGGLDPDERGWTMAGRRYCDGHDPEGNVLQLHAEVPASLP